MNAFKQQCIELRKQNYTLGEITKITGKPKTSVYAHIRDIPLSEKRVAEVKEQHKARLLQIATRRKGVSNRPFKRFTSWNKSAVCLVAHLLFDGTIERRSCVYNNRSTALMERVELCMRTIYPFKPTRSFNNESGVHRISYHNVALGAYLINKSVDLKLQIHRMDRQLQQEFLRAFFDDEGCIDYRAKRNTRQVRGYQKNTEILKLVQVLLANFGIVARLAAPNEVVITGKGNLAKFQKEIGFSAGVCINGNRSNSTWKQPFEKRELLRRAIASFKV